MRGGMVRCAAASALVVISLSCEISEAADPGFYVGAAAGRGEQKIDMAAGVGPMPTIDPPGGFIGVIGDPSRPLPPIFNPGPVFIALEQESVADETDAAWNVALGYRVNKFLAAELARGVPHRGGRSRSEILWTTVTTIDQCRQRLEESRRMRLATLDVWPNPPHLDNTYQTREDGPFYGPLARFIMGLSHEDSHLGQIADIIQQAKAARS